MIFKEDDYIVRYKPENIEIRSNYRCNKITR